ncbi:penicillin-insensitive murein endopeptidase [Crocinitomix catalasitica]|uniref:penicillin-insensitive murein endopeptidase n=1 Tax=Crocinitomix catalasitica TaxID=184607 RepID=UPI000482EABC|nr:penicillin-insensitive murein endopeptidase [Crocinitomix catalasitica]
MKILSPISLILFLPFLSFCQNQVEIDEDNSVKYDQEILDYMAKHPQNDQPSISLGTPGNGSLKNGKLLPFYGENHTYFDKKSYLAGRAFLNSYVLNLALSAYDSLFVKYPNRKFGIMECANQHGGKLYPHRTHQNGLSIDFMMPLLKDGQPYYGADSLGVQHYLMEFNDDGKLLKDQSIEIDFNLVAEHILILAEKADEENMKIEKVIIKIELKDELFATDYGKKLKASGIYVVKGLTPLVNSLHDDHFHIDFKL